ncbi:hypothetical protein PC116_g24207 [Phytophthora cactorum]|nr:hypothetical protein Pcac1_g16666 [Phytophthora cactorum]KAG3152479.1 hypothetical protein PC128_g22765 [Phytophthora cactorum]KAG3161135.1 hypothetical protein C6341_g13677 [Phytophthora cactorum]KAG4227399.1 hypothetical protein PC116_g24207 [Phytophthora cactorum]
MHVRERKSNRAIAKLLGRDEKAIRNYLRVWEGILSDQEDWQKAQINRAGGQEGLLADYCERVIG